MSLASDSYPWYKKVPKDSILEQGDLIYKCQIVEPSIEAYEENQTLTADVCEYDIIVMSQSCDLEAEKINLVLVCPFYTLNEMGRIYSDYKSTNMKNKLRQGRIVGNHLLNRDEDNNINDFLVVDFKNVYAVPLKFLKKIIVSRENRVRLLPPYREHLSQAFARFFMRVGLPLDIPEF